MSPSTGSKPEISIVSTESGTRISWQTASEETAFEHSFVESDFFYRRAVSANQAILKACSNKQNNIRNILDLTAGWGVDSFVLAQHGKSVTMLEQNRFVHAVLSNSLKQALDHSHTMGAARRIKAICCNSLDFLDELKLNHSFDCIYLDPMFPAHKSQAKPGKELQLLRQLTDNFDIEACFEKALNKARKRVVVKRPAKAPSLCNRKPDLSYREKSIRFDVYMTAVDQ